MMVNDSIPYEIMQRIVTELMGETGKDSTELSRHVTKDLCACALISSSWLPAARCELWRQFVVPNCNGRSFEKMLPTFSSPYSTLQSASIRELVYDHWTPYRSSSDQGPSHFFEWLGSPAHPDTSETSLQYLFQVRSLSLRHTELIHPDDDEDAESNPRSLSPAATAVLLHSFDAITTFKLEYVEVLSIGQLSAILHAFPKLVELHLIEVQFSSRRRRVYGNISIFEDCETSQPDSGSRCLPAPLLQNLRFHEGWGDDTLSFTQLPLMVSLHPFVHNLELVIFLTDEALSSIAHLLANSSVQQVELKDLGIKQLDPDFFPGGSDNDNSRKFTVFRAFEEIFKFYTSDRSSNRTLSSFAAVRGLKSFSLDSPLFEEFLPFLTDLPHDTLETLIIPRLGMAFEYSGDRLDALDRTIHHRFTSLKSLKFDVDTYIPRANTSLWNAWKAAQLSRDDSQMPVMKEGLFWETVKAKYDEIAERLPLCNKEGWLKPLFRYFEAWPSSPPFDGTGDSVYSLVSPTEGEIFDGSV